jgi:hypothetical protein
MKNKMTEKEVFLKDLEEQLRSEGQDEETINFYIKKHKECIDDLDLFDHVEDSVEYVKDLRKSQWHNRGHYASLDWAGILEDIEPKMTALELQKEITDSRSEQ